MQVAAGEAVIAWAALPGAAQSPAVAEALKQLYALAWPSNVLLIRTITRHAAQLAAGSLAVAAFGSSGADLAEAKAQISMVQVQPVPRMQALTNCNSDLMVVCTLAVPWQHDHGS